MSNLQIINIGRWKDDKLSFAGATAFVHQKTKNAFLISPYGTSIILTAELLDQVTKHHIDSFLHQKLQARGFIGDFSRPDVRCCSGYTPEFLMIDITTKCNMNCFYCLRHFEHSGENIHNKELVNILDYIISYYNQVKHPLVIQPWGGEPLIAIEQIRFIDDYLRQANVQFHITIQTNGMLLTDQMAKELFDRDIDIGISIDGCQYIHDLHRKDLAYNPTFNKVCEGIKNAQKYYGRKLGTISVISKNSLSCINESIDFLVKRLGISTLKFNFLHPNSDLFDMSYVVDDSQLDDYWRNLIDKLIELNKKGYSCTESNTFDKILNLLTGSCGDICHANGCTGGYNLISFSQNGDIYPCEMIGNEEYKLGSIYDNVALPKLIINSIPKNQYFVEKKNDRCVSCCWNPYCRGGCTAAAKFYGRGVGEVDQKECCSNCSIYPLLIETMLSDLDTVELLTNGKIVRYI